MRLDTTIQRALMRFSQPQIVLQEVPGEISLALSISGCSLNCKGCHSTETFDKTFGDELTSKLLDEMIAKHKHISCILFYGGEWLIDELEFFLKYIKDKGLKTCLYTGRELTYFKPEFLKNLDYIKVGRYIEKLGGLNEPGTNQKFIKL